MLWESTQLRVSFRVGLSVSFDRQSEVGLGDHYLVADEFDVEVR